MSAIESMQNHAGFLDRFGHVFEHSPWIAERAWEQYQARTAAPPLTADNLVEMFSAVIRSATTEQKLELLRAHPELAVAVDRRDSLTEASQSEQKGAGLDRCTADEYQAFSDLNRQYRERFGFPFIMAVSGFQRAEILDELKRRVDNSHEQEFETAVNQVIRIGQLRTEATLAEEATGNAE